MAIAEHEITPQEVTQSITIHLTASQAATLRQAAAGQGQSMEDFAATAIADAAQHSLSPTSPLPARRASLDSLFGLIEFEPELDALMEHIHEEQKKGIEQFRAEEAAQEAAEQAKAQQ